MFPKKYGIQTELKHLNTVLNTVNNKSITPSTVKYELVYSLQIPNNKTRTGGSYNW